jgi:hypothetical protein
MSFNIARVVFIIVTLICALFIGYVTFGTHQIFKEVTSSMALLPSSVSSTLQSVQEKSCMWRENCYIDAVGEGADIDEIRAKQIAINSCQGKIQQQLAPGGTFYECTQKKYKKCDGEFAGGEPCSITLRPIDIRPCGIVDCINRTTVNGTAYYLCIAEGHGYLTLLCGPQWANIKDIN